MPENFQASEAPASQEIRWFAGLYLEVTFSLKTSNDTLRLIIALGAMIFVGLVLLLLPSIWPMYELYRIGFICVGLGVSLAVFGFLAIEIEAKDLERRPNELCTSV